MRYRAARFAGAAAARWLAVIAVLAAFGGPAWAGGTLRIGVYFGLANPFTGITYSPYVLHPLQFDALVDIGERGEVLPALALSWSAETPKVWVFSLRPGVAFSNGEPFDADAVVATLDWLRSAPGQTTAARRETRSISGARARDPLTVEIVTDQPDLMLPGKLFSVKMMPPKYLAATGMDRFAIAPVGTGPFKEIERDTARVAFVRNEASWRAPKLDGVELISIQSPVVRVQALRAGQIDLAIDVQPEDVALLRDDGYTVVTHPVSAVSVAQFVTTRTNSPMKDRRVRLALNYAVDKKAIVASLMRGLTRVPTQFAPSYAFGALRDAPPAFPYDPERAKALLADAGYPGGFAMSIELMANFGSIVYEQLIADLGRVGVKVTLKTPPVQEFTRRLFAGDWDSDAFDYGYIVFPAMDALAPLRLHSCLNSKAWFCDEDVTARMVAADAMFDHDTRRAATEQIMRDLLADPPGLLLFESFRSFATVPALRGQESDLGLIRYENLEFAR